MAAWKSRSSSTTSPTPGLGRGLLGRCSCAAGDGTVPEAIARAIAVPTLVMDGEKTMEFMHATADRVAALIPRAERKTLKGQTHEAAPEATAPVLIEFFKSRSE